MKTYENFITDLFKKKRTKTDVLKENDIFIIFSYFESDSNYKKEWIDNFIDNYLILGQIVFKGFPSEYYRTVNIINSISEEPHDIIGARSVDYNINRINIIHETKDLIDAQNKFNELLEEEPYATWILNQTANKYNL